MTALGALRVAHVSLLVLFLPVFVPASLHARELKSLFAREADVYADRAGLMSLPLPAEVLAECRADLGDLRLFDHRGDEVPYIVDTRFSRRAAVESERRVDAKVLNVERGEKRSEDGPPIFFESYEISAPASPPDQGAWQLVLSTSRSRYVRRMTVRRLSDDGETTLVETSLFDVGSETKNRIDLPPFDGGRLLVSLAGADGSYLEPSFHFVSVRRLPAPPQLVVPLEEVARERKLAPKRTELLLRRRRGLVPDRLRFATSTQAFSRVVRVSDIRRGTTERELASGQRVFRIAGGSDLQQLEIGIHPARGDLLRVTIDDGDSPPLADLVVSAVVPQPTLLFWLDRAPEGPFAATLRFGGGRTGAPRYDLASLLPEYGAAPSDVPAEAAAEMLRRAVSDADHVTLARLEHLRDNQEFYQAPALAFVMHAGASVDARVFSHRRSLRIQPSAEGLARVDLEPADLAVARADLADVRIVDATGRQWPYLLERDAAFEWSRVPFERRSERGASRYRLRLPHTPAVVGQLNVDTRGDDQFDRAYRVIATRPDGGERTVAAGRIAHKPDDGGYSLVLNLEPVRATALTIVVEDGDDAPLDVAEIRARFPLPSLFVAAPAGTYWLMLGHADARAPRYEIERVRDIVLAVDAAEVPGGTLERNPEFSLRARLTEAGAGTATAQRALVWGALVLAVVVLAGITLRLARQ